MRFSVYRLPGKKKKEKKEKKKERSVLILARSAQ
jgi:hypothetical protein